MTVDELMNITTDKKVISDKKLINNMTRNGPPITSS
jgi:hypothetical protein